MKKIIAVLMVLVMALCFAACGGSDSSSGDTDSSLTSNPSTRSAEVTESNMMADDFVIQVEDGVATVVNNSPFMIVNFSAIYQAKPDADLNMFKDLEVNSIDKAATRVPVSSMTSGEVSENNQVELMELTSFMGWTTDTPATQEQFDACEFYGYSMDIVGEDSVVYEVLYSAEDDSWEVEASDTYSCEWPTGGLMEGVPEATIGVAVLCEPEYIESLSSNEVYIYGTTAKEVKQYAKELKEAGFSKDFSIDTYDDGSVYASGSNGSKDVSIKFHPEYNRAELWVSEY